MSFTTVAFYAVFLFIILVLVEPVGGYLARVFSGQKTWLDPALRPIERFIYTLGGVDAERGMNGKEYALAFVFFTLRFTLKQNLPRFKNEAVSPGHEVMNSTHVHHKR